MPRLCTIGYWEEPRDHTRVHKLDVTRNVQIYGLINNLFDTHYGLFGNYFNLADANGAAAAAGLGSNFFTNPETVVPGAPLAAYGGVRVKF